MKSKPIIEIIKNQFCIKEKETFNIDEYSKIRFENNRILDNIYLISEKYENKNKNIYDFSKIIDGNQAFNERIIFIIFDVEELVEFLLKIIKKYYMHLIIIYLFIMIQLKDIKILQITF